MTKKYNLILSKTRLGMCRDYLVGYVKDMNGYAYLNYKLRDETFNKPYAQFTQDEINKLKAKLPTGGMRAVVDASKVEVKEPLYYMQTKRTNRYGYRFFFMIVNDSTEAENTDCEAAYSIKAFLNCADKTQINQALLPRAKWEPYLTPDRELVKYKPKEDN